ncbi:MAG: hypothetical protein KOO60_04535 [Gemmatimonadales bacterium]|nr:hypothetical protein [Gemmatimonadales bacterium]
MAHPLMNPVHKFYIPVMGTGFTIDTPLKVARYGISSVVSLVDDVLIEQMRKCLTRDNGQDYEEIRSDEEDSRAKRITSYLNMMDEMVENQIEKLRTSIFEKGSEITKYFEMLPESPLRSLYTTMQNTLDPEERARLQETLRRKISPGGIDVNIMTKLDRARLSKGQDLGPKFSDAMSALRGYASSHLRSSLVLSAGMNRKLFSYLAEFGDFFPDDVGDVRKCIVLKVSDFRSALIQGKLLAKQGLWVSEYRIESGLNCGGHAFGGKGTLLGPVLEEFRDKKEALRDQVYDTWVTGLENLGRSAPGTPLEFRVTVQGGIGTAEENELLEKTYQVDGTGWASPFLLVPEVVNIDPAHVEKIIKARENDVHLSESSPLGVPFWSLKTSASEEHRLELIHNGKPGSACPKGFLVSNTEFTKAPICAASRAYQRRKLDELDHSELSREERDEIESHVMAKACICHDLAGSATVPRGIDPDANTAVCCGPNTVYFSQVAKLREMVDHIYGRINLPLNSSRPHMFLKELSLHLDGLRAEAERRRKELGACNCSADKVRDNLLSGIRHYRDLATRLVSGQKDEFSTKLETLRGELDRIR